LRASFLLRLAPSAGAILHRLELEISQEMLTGRELIACRVHDEVTA
jgi:hypothetical protein